MPLVSSEPTDGCDGPSGFHNDGNLACGQLTLTGVVAAAAPGSGTPTGSVQFVDTSSNAVVGSTKACSPVRSP
jgi:hypothetical protein